MRKPAEPVNGLRRQAIDASDAGSGPTHRGRGRLRSHLEAATAGETRCHGPRGNQSNSIAGATGSRSLIMSGSMSRIAAATGFVGVAIFQLSLAPTPVHPTAS
jgi:hypothetical protein